MENVLLPAFDITAFLIQLIEEKGPVERSDAFHYRLCKPDVAHRLIRSMLVGMIAFH